MKEVLLGICWSMIQFRRLHLDTPNLPVLLILDERKEVEKMIGQFTRRYINEITLNTFQVPLYWV